MSTITDIDTPSTNGLRKALLFVSDDRRPLWGWWCPECTQARGLLIRQADFESRGGARRAAQSHEKRREHNR